MMAAARVGTLGAAESYLDSLINHERRGDWPYRRLGLDPIRALLARLGNPEHKLRSSISRVPRERDPPPFWWRRS